MIDNRSIVQKADLQVSNMLADGGYLQPAQAQRFIRTLIDESVIMPQATVTPMRAPTQLIESARFGSRILRAGTEAQALSLADRSKPDLDKVELNAQLFKAEVRLNNEVLEDSIERKNLRATVIQLMGDRMALDMDEVIAQGDTASADPFLAKFDGIIKQSSVNTVSNGSNPISRSFWKDMLKTMPSEFLRNKRRLRFFTSVDAELDYRDQLAARATGVGDKFLENDAPVAYSGVPIIDVPVFPENLGGGTNETVAILTDPKNVNVGIWRKIAIETDKDISSGTLIVVATVRFDAKYAEDRATVKGTGITVS